MSTVNEIVTHRIIEMLERGVVPWVKPWHVSTGLPRSLTTQKEYRGINLLLTGCQGYESPYWLTYRQAKELGANVRKGEKGTPIIFWSKRCVKNDESGEDQDQLIARYYMIFNVAQVDGLKLRREMLYPAPAVGSGDVHATAERIAAGYLNGPAVASGYMQAAYSPATDTVRMLRREAFTRAEEYYSTLFHELVHSTGHESRLNRDSLRKIARFGDHEYSREELVAEIGSAMLCAEAGISERVIDNQAAYISGWLKVLHGDSRAIVVAAAQAQKAVELIAGKSRALDTETDADDGAVREAC